MKLPRLLILTDRHQLPSGRALVDQLSGLTGDVAVLLREPDLPWPERERLAAQIAEFAPVIAAREVLRASIGTHLSAQQPPLRGRHFAGHPWGRSCHSVDDVTRAADEGASWVTLGSVAETSSKPGYQPQVSTDDLATAAPLASVYALGGVTPANAKALVQTGIHGLAVMGTVMRADDPAAVVELLLEAVA